MKKLLGVLALAMGCCFALWIGYNLFIERLPETKGKSPFFSIILTVLFFYQGRKWLRGD